jgi:hypothetical protein
MKIWKKCWMNKPACFSVVFLVLLGSISIFEFFSNLPDDSTQYLIDNKEVSMPTTVYNAAMTTPIMGTISNRTADYNGEVINPPPQVKTPEPQPAPELESEKPEKKPAITIIPVLPFNGSSPEKMMTPEKPKTPEIKPVPVPTGSPKPYVVQEVPTQHTGINVTPAWNNPGWGNISPTWNNPGWRQQANVSMSNPNWFSNAMAVALWTGGKVGKVANGIPIPKVETSTKTETQHMKRVGMDSKMNNDNLSRGPQNSVHLGRT